MVLPAKAQEEVSMPKNRECGFSVIELVIVLSIFLIVIAIALPSMRQFFDNYRMNASARDVASILQQASMAAKQARQPYYVTFDANNKVVAVPASRFGAPQDSDPTTQLPSHVSFQGNPPTVTGLDPAAVANATIGFDARGLPCNVNAAAPWQCTVGGTVAYEWFMKSSSTQAWVAVIVSPAGRVRSLHMDSSGWPM
jgi:prepilin-type N-terminal cleavage/methylation domain-containing protein